MSRRAALFLLYVIFLGCQSRVWNRGSVTSDTAQTAVRLEASDISVLFPPAGVGPIFERRGTASFWLESLVFGVKAVDRYSVSESQAEVRIAGLVKRGFWPSLTGSDGGRTYLPARELQEILNAFQPSVANTKETPSPGPLTIRSFKSLSDDWSVAVPEGAGTPPGFELLSFDMKASERWRIVSMRLDPCPYGHLKEAASADDNSESNAERGVCRPEIRLVAQPVLGLDSNESFAGSILPANSVAVSTARRFAVYRLNFFHIPASVSHRGWFFADYGVHLFYRISDEQLAATARALLALKQKYAGQCGRDMKSLAVNPCLRAAWLGAAQPEELKRYINNDGWGAAYDFPHSFALKQAVNRNAEAWSQSTFAKEIVEIYSSALETPYKAAVMASSGNIDPWLFRLFDRNRSGNWIAKQIRALDSAALGDPGEKSFRSNIRKDLSNSKLQVVPRGANLALEDIASGLGSTNNDESKRRRAKDRLTPTDRTKLDSLDFFLRTAFRRQTEAEFNLLLGEVPNDQRRGFQRITPTGNRNMDLLQVAARINNPHLNDEFSTSCASCHLVGIETTLMPDNWEHFPHLKDSTGSPVLNPLDFHLAKTVRDWQPLLRTIAQREGGPDTALMKKHEYQSRLPSFTPRSSEYQNVQVSKTDDAFIFNQFSIYRNSPIISLRVAHETDLALQDIRKKVFGDDGTAETTVCNGPALRSCMALTFSGYWLGAETVEEHCWHPEARICRPK